MVALIPRVPLSGIVVAVVVVGCAVEGWIVETGNFHVPCDRLKTASPSMTILLSASRKFRIRPSVTSTRQSDFFQNKLEGEQLAQHHGLDVCACSVF